MVYGLSNGHVTDDVTWSWTVKLVTPIPLERNISKTAGFRDSVPKYYGHNEMAYGLSNGHVNDDVTRPPKVLWWGCTVGYPSDSFIGFLYLIAIYFILFCFYSILSSQVRCVRFFSCSINCGDIQYMCELRNDRFSLRLFNSLEWLSWKIDRFQVQVWVGLKIEIHEIHEIHQNLRNPVSKLAFKLVTSADDISRPLLTRWRRRTWTVDEIKVASRS